MEPLLFSTSDGNHHHHHDDHHQNQCQSHHHHDDDHRNQFGSQMGIMCHNNQVGSIFDAEGDKQQAYQYHFDR